MIRLIVVDTASFALYTAMTKWGLQTCQLAVFSGTLPSMEAEIDDKLPSNSS